jgi:hypothetical protein
MTLTLEQKTDVYPAATLEGTGNCSALAHGKKCFRFSGACWFLPTTPMLLSCHKKNFLEKKWNTTGK